MIFIMAMLSSSLALAQSTTNSIFIEQVGDNSNITIVQKGQNNKIGSEQNRVILNGQGQTINTTQWYAILSTEYAKYEWIMKAMNESQLSELVANIKSDLRKQYKVI
jgi:hypothetical protein